MSRNNFFLQHFDTLEICNLTADLGDDKNCTSAFAFGYKTLNNGCWVKGLSAGGCRNYIDSFATNPQFFLEISDASLCLLSLMQKGFRKRMTMSESVLSIGIKIMCSRGHGPISFLLINFSGFAIYRIEKEFEKKSKLNEDFFKYHASFGRTTFVNKREVTARFEFKPGSYVIIPSTFEPDFEADFMLRIFSERPMTLCQV